MDEPLEEGWYWVSQYSAEQMVAHKGIWPISELWEVARWNGCYFEVSGTSDADIAFQTLGPRLQPPQEKE